MKTLNRAVLSSMQRVYAFSLRGAHNEFLASCIEPRGLQQKILFRTLASNNRSVFGRRFGFEQISTVKEFQRRIPITDYDFFEPWIKRIGRGEPSVLTEAPVLFFERSGGSTATTKLIPYTQGLLAEFSQATRPWIHDLHRNIPGLYGTRSYWSISPVSRAQETTEAGIPIGIESDTQYFNGVARRLFERSMVVSSDVARIPDLNSWRHKTLEYLVEANDLGLISVWHPSFLTLIMKDLKKEWDIIASKLTVRRRREVESAVEKTGFCGEAIWPQLNLISCWADGVAAEFIPDLRTFFPHTPIQPKGLLATEGVVSFPLAEAGGAVLAIDSHFLEFVDLENPSAAPVLADELRVGAHYSPLLTTAGGFYRYRLKDIVLCSGKFRATPMIRFVEKEDMITDLCGEKLAATQVDEAFQSARVKLGFKYDFGFVAPRWEDRSSAPYYQLFVETELEDTQIAEACREIESHLLSGHHYRYCRDLGQLGPLRWRRITDGIQNYQDMAVLNGQRVGDIKPSHLLGRAWADRWIELLKSGKKGD